MARQKVQPKTFKPMPPPLPDEPVIQADEPALIAHLATFKGMNRDLARQMVSNGIPDDAVIIQQRYGVEASTAAEILAAVKET